MSSLLERLKEMNKPKERAEFSFKVLLRETIEYLNTKTAKATINIFDIENIEHIKDIQARMKTINIYRNDFESALRFEDIEELKEYLDDYNLERFKTLEELKENLETHLQDYEVESENLEKELEERSSKTGTKRKLKEISIKKIYNDEFFYLKDTKGIEYMTREKIFKRCEINENLKITRENKKYSIQFQDNESLIEVEFNLNVPKKFLVELDKWY